MKRRSTLRHLLLHIVGPPLAATAILFVPIPIPTDLMTYFPGLVFLAAALLAAIVAARGFQISHSSNTNLLAMIVTIVVFGLPLAWLWNHAATTDNVINGLLQHSDARAYLTGALAFKDAGEITGFNTWRPLATTFLAGTLVLADGSIQATQAALVFGSALACCLAAIAVWRSHGLPAAAITLATLGVFYQHHTGSFLSENLGLMLGASAFALVWEGHQNHRPGWSVSGLFFLSLALNARAGAMFVLPLLLLFLFLDVRGGRARKAALAAAGTVAIVSGFLVTYLLVWRYGGHGPAIPFGNFAPSFYGLVSGGEGWTRVYQDHPELAAMPRTESFGEIYRFAFAKLGNEPAGLLRGVVAAYNDYLFNAEWHKYIDSWPARALAYLLTVAGLIGCVRRPTESGFRLVAWATAGILLSVPFMSDGGHRVYAATMPFTAALLAMGLVYLRPSAAVEAAADRMLPRAWPFVPFAAGMLLAVVAVPGAILFASDGEGSARYVRCPEPLRQVVVDLSKGSSLLVVPDDAEGRSRVPVITERDFRAGFPEAFRPAALVTLVSPPAAVSWVRDLGNGRAFWLIAPAHLLPSGASEVGFCGTLRSGIFEARSRVGKVE